MDTKTMAMALFVVSSEAQKVTEYFGLGNYKDGVCSWYFRTADGTVEGRFENMGSLVGANLALNTG